MYYYLPTCFGCFCDHHKGVIQDYLLIYLHHGAEPCLRS